MGSLAAILRIACRDARAGQACKEAIILGKDDIGSAKDSNRDSEELEVVHFECSQHWWWV